MNTKITVTKDLFAHDFLVTNRHRMDADKLTAAVNKILSTDTSYSASGSVASFIFYLQFQVIIKSGKTFDGKAGGVTTPGGGALFGDVYTDDLDQLYAETKAFAFIATPVYIGLSFFDKSANLLGSFQSGAVSTVAGNGGGSGSWS